MIRGSRPPRSRPRARGRIFGPVFAAVALLLLPAGHPALPGEPLRVVLALDQERAVYRRLIQGVERELRRNGAGAAMLNVLDLPGHRYPMTDALPAADLYVAAGTAATAEIAGFAQRGPLISVLVPRLNFEKLLPDDERGSPRPRTWSAIFLDQPFERQLDLIRLVLPESRRIGVALGPATKGYLAELARASAARRLRLQARLMSPGDNLVRELNELLPGSDAMLGIIDPLVFNRANAHKILLTAYRHRVPLIGASPAYVRAGALAAVYSTPEQIGRELGELIVQWSNAGAVELPAPRYPRHFSVTVNRQVALSLGLSPPDDEDLARRLGATP